MLLYKYRSLSADSIEYTKKIISERGLYFAAPNSFNDPFEFHPAVSLEASKDEFSRYIDDLYKRKLPWMSRDSRRASVKALLQDRARNHKSLAANQVFNDALLELRSKCGVLCLSEDPINILMWSHYADCHRGVCFGFDASNTNMFFGRAQKVTYSQEYPRINIIKDRKQDLQDRTILTKSIHWSYEREWRIVDPKRGVGVQLFSCEDLQEVIFGVNVSSECLHQILEALNNSELRPKVFKAKLHDSNYEIVLSKIDF